MLSTIAKIFHPRNVPAIIALAVASYSVGSFIHTQVKEYQRRNGREHSNSNNGLLLHATTGSGNNNTGSSNIDTVTSLSGHSPLDHHHHSHSSHHAVGTSSINDQTPLHPTRSGGGLAAAAAVSSSFQDKSADERISEVARSSASSKLNFTWLDERTGLAVHVAFRHAVPCGVERSDAGAATEGSVTLSMAPANPSTKEAQQYLQQFDVSARFVAPHISALAASSASSLLEIFALEERRALEAAGFDVVSSKQQQMQPMKVKLPFAGKLASPLLNATATEGSSTSPSCVFSQQELSARLNSKGMPAAAYEDVWVVQCERNNNNISNATSEMRSVLVLGHPLFLNSGCEQQQHPPVVITIQIHHSKPINWSSPSAPITSVVLPSILRLPPQLANNTGTICVSEPRCAVGVQLPAPLSALQFGLPEEVYGVLGVGSGEEFSLGAAAVKSAASQSATNISSNNNAGGGLRRSPSLGASGTPAKRVRVVTPRQQQQNEQEQQQQQTQQQQQPTRKVRVIKTAASSCSSTSANAAASKANGSDRGSSLMSGHSNSHQHHHHHHQQGAVVPPFSTVYSLDQQQAQQRSQSLASSSSISRAASTFHATAAAVRVIPIISSLARSSNSNPHQNSPSQQNQYHEVLPSTQSSSLDLTTVSVSSSVFAGHGHQINNITAGAAPCQHSNVPSVHHPIACGVVASSSEAFKFRFGYDFCFDQQQQQQQHSAAAAASMSTIPAPPPSSPIPIGSTASSNFHSQHHGSSQHHWNQERVIECVARRCVQRVMSLTSPNSESAAAAAAVVIQCSYLPQGNHLQQQVSMQSNNSPQHENLLNLCFFDDHLVPLRDAAPIRMHGWKGIVSVSPQSQSPLPPPSATPSAAHNPSSSSASLTSLLRGQNNANIMSSSSNNPASSSALSSTSSSSTSRGRTLIGCCFLQIPRDSIRYLGASAALGLIQHFLDEGGTNNISNGTISSTATVRNHLPSIDALLTASMNMAESPSHSWVSLVMHTTIPTTTTTDSSSNDCVLEQRFRHVFEMCCRSISVGRVAAASVAAGVEYCSPRSILNGSLRCVLARFSASSSANATTTTAGKRSSAPSAQSSPEWAVKRQHHQQQQQQQFAGAAAADEHTSWGVIEPNNGNPTMLFYRLDGRDASQLQFVSLRVRQAPSLREMDPLFVSLVNLLGDSAADAGGVDAARNPSSRRNKKQPSTITGRALRRLMHPDNYDKLFATHYQAYLERLFPDAIVYSPSIFDGSSRRECVAALVDEDRYQQLAAQWPNGGVGFAPVAHATSLVHNTVTEATTSSPSLLVHAAAASSVPMQQRIIAFALVPPRFCNDFEAVPSCARHSGAELVHGQLAVVGSGNRNSNNSSIMIGDDVELDPKQYSPLLDCSPRVAIEIHSSPFPVSSCHGVESQFEVFLKQQLRLQVVD